MENKKPCTKISYLDTSNDKIELKVEMTDGKTYCFDSSTTYIIFSEKRFLVKGIHPSLKMLIKDFKGIKFNRITLNGFTLHDNEYMKFRLSNFERVDRLLTSYERSDARSLMNEQVDRVKADSSIPEEDKNIKAKEIKAEWSNEIAYIEEANKKYLGLFDDLEKERYRSFQTKNLKRIYYAKKRQLKKKKFWMDFSFEMLNGWDRFFLAHKRKFKKARKREEQLQKVKKPLTINCKNEREILLGLENYVIGVVGQEKFLLVDERKHSIGENLISILMAVQGMRRQEAYDYSIELMEALGIFKAKEVVKYKSYQFINEDFQLKIQLSYLLAFNPKIVVMDCSSLTNSRQLLKEITTRLIELKKKMNFIFVIYDDVMMDKTFEPKDVFVVSKDLSIVKKEE